MDSFDRQIWKALFLDVRGYPARSELRESFSSIARKLEVTEPTVRSRIKKFVELGYLKGWNFLVNPNAVGQHLGQVMLELPPSASKLDCISKIRLVDGVWFIGRYHTNRLCVGICYQDKATLDRRIELIVRIVDPKHVVYGEFTFPPSAYRFSPVDVAIARSIQVGPWQPWSILAKQAGASEKTVKRRLIKMMTERALFMAPIVDPGKIVGLLPVDVYLFYAKNDPARQAEQQVLALVKDMLITTAGGPEHTYISLLLDSLKQIKESREQVGSLRGVRETVVDLIEEYLPLYEGYRRELERLFETREQSKALLAK